MQFMQRNREEITSFQNRIEKIFYQNGIVCDNLKRLCSEIKSFQLNQEGTPNYCAERKTQGVKWFEKYQSSASWS
jgi:hypothetical protein